jgi:hypothetical protein
MGTLSINNLEAIVTSNMVRYLPITLDDINIAERIFGPDVCALKGETTPVVSDCIEIPTELITKHQYITLCMDGMKLNGMPFLTKISRNIMY